MGGLKNVLYFRYLINRLGSLARTFIKPITMRSVVRINSFRVWRSLRMGYSSFYFLMRWSELFSDVWKKKIIPEDILSIFQDPTRIHFPVMLPASLKAVDYEGTLLKYFSNLPNVWNAIHSSVCTEGMPRGLDGVVTEVENDIPDPYTPVTKSLFFYIILHRRAAGAPIALNVDSGQTHHIQFDLAASADIKKRCPVEVMPKTWTLTLATSSYEDESASFAVKVWLQLKYGNGCIDDIGMCMCRSRGIGLDTMKRRILLGSRGWLC
ncbi:hypothetical protein M422DRAFT_50194 [Sphaerobolus stellatus SS14]|uniref:Unplaced genomic scaffold SPHSTscaffold_89, whole genome shotgun sequence n=1 Tax=Sphaerobolus stellatus (strain SS14) TaxID=990650 RepID=A0A0C9V8Z7_SPHS4|nr:hypothetical protein M422DRAFT_50194 [Sphaerobolus stellatus SS14]